VGRWISTLAAGCCLFAFAQAEATGLETRKTTGLKLPRFASLKSAEVNLRTGPGTRYPVDWVLIYRNMPVEIVGEFEAWRKVRDWQGTEGWVHRSMLSGRRWAIVRKGIQPLRRAPKPGAPLVAQVQRKSVGRVLQCRNAWCRLNFAGVEGWMQRAELWGVYPKEPIE